MLINCSNHPYEMWTAAQREAAEHYGEVMDLPFPSIDPAVGSSDLRRITEEYSEKIEALSPEAVFVAGEFTFVFMLVDKLLQDGVKVLSSCSKRIAREEKKEDGSIEKKSVFLFECFREYAYYKYPVQEEKQSGKRIDG